MKHIIVSVIFLSLTQALFAARFSSTIHSIDFGKTSEQHLIRFHNGRVTFVNPNDFELIESLVLSSKKFETIEVQTDNENILYAVQTVNPLPDQDHIGDIEWAPQSKLYNPSIMRDWNGALGVYNRMRRDYSLNGECYNRAHIWGYEEFQRTKLNSMKIFMFFTERYIRNYRFHWWFHVTPMVYVANLSSPRTLDKRYTTGPIQTKTWSDVFVRSKRACRIVKKFENFWLNQQSEDCYHIYTSMYYVIPRDIEKRDLTGIEKSEFYEKEIRKAYQNGFNR
jgi:hypothetical protein